MRVLCLLVFAVVAVLTDAQTLRILSQRQNAYALNGRMYQNNTITVQCTDADFGVYRYATITKGDGSTVQLGVLCSPPVYSYELEEVGKVPRDTRLDSVTYCLTADDLKVDTVPINELLDRTTTPAVIGNSIRRRKLMIQHGRHLARSLNYHRKFPLLAAVGIPLLAGFAGGVAGGALYCQAIGCVKQSDLTPLRESITGLEGSVTNLKNNLSIFEGKFTNLTNTYAAMFTMTENRFEKVEALFNNSITGVQASLDYVNGTNEFLRQQNQNLQYNFQVLQTQAAATDVNIAVLSQTLASGISGVSGELANFIALQNNVTEDTHLRLVNVSQIAAANLVTLRNQVAVINKNLQTQLQAVRDQFRETQARRAVAATIHQRLPDILLEGYAPFTFDLGTAPGSDSNPAVWRTLLETHRLLYIRDNLGLTAQMVDVSYYCGTQVIIDYSISLQSSSDFLGAIGPVGCNATLRRGCNCWVVTQRSSCATSLARVINGTWLENNTIWTGDANAVCSGAVTVNEAVTHNTLPSFMSVMAAVCNDGTAVNATDIRVISGQLLRVASVPYNPLVCSMALDTINELGLTGISFIYTMLGYLQLSFTVVLNNANYYAKVVYGQSPSGLTTLYDPLVVLNGTEARCLFTGMVSHDVTNPLLDVYRLRFVSATSSITVKLDGVVTNVVTDVTVSVPSSIILPETDTAVVGDPADSSEIWNIPNEELSLSPVAAARQGHVTYPIAPNLSGLTISAWQERNKATFNHFEGSATAAYYRRDLNGTGMCTGNSLPGEGSWCTVRRDFAVSAAVGGFTLSPRTGTGATVLGQLIIPDGAITSVIFSDCPTITLAQKNPGVATLTLTNSRPDVDITIAILLTGQCTTTVPSFTIPSLQQRDYLIPQCISNVDSTRTVRVARYDAELNLVTCGNTTNITISRDTFISTYSTPDLISVNITRQLSEDQANLAVLAAINAQNQVVANFITTLPLIFQNYGVALPNSTVSSLVDLITALQEQATAYAVQANNTRNAQLRNFTVLYDEFAPRLDAALADGILALNASKALLQQLAAQNVNASSILADIIVLTNETQAALAGVITALNAFANATRDVAIATLNTFAEMNDVGAFDALNPFFDFMGNAIRATGNGLNSAVDWAIDKASKVAKIGENLFETITGIPGSFMKWLVYIGIAAISIAIIVALFTLLYKHQARKVMVGTLTGGDLAPITTVEQAQAVVDMYTRAQSILSASRTASVPVTANTSAPVVGGVGATASAPVMSLPTMGWSNTAVRPRPADDARPLLKRVTTRQYNSPPRPQIPGGDYDLE